MKKKKQKAKPQQVELLDFKDNKGNTIILPDNLTLGHLVTLGIKKIKLEPVGAPVPDFWYAHNPAAPAK
jgi:hypothetical protein